MGVTVDCLRCVNSACCRLTVEVDRDEYNSFKSLGLSHHFNTRTEIFIAKNPKHKKHTELFNEMYRDNYATIKKREDGYCVLLNKKMECSIYADRPKACRDYKQLRCVNIRQLK